MFGVQRIEVEGAPPALAARIRTVLQPLVGTSLVTFSSGDADRRLATLPTVAHAHYDRDFPHTLRVTVKVEEPVAILRRGPDAWTVSSSGRVLGALAHGSYPPLPRIWLAADADVTVGLPAGPTVVRPLIVATLVRAEHFRARVRIVRQDARGKLSLEVASGREVRLGAPHDLPLKLAVAEAILPRIEGAQYIDVSVPSRAVAGYASASDGVTTEPSEAQVSG